MSVNPLPITIKAISDDHLVSFLRCPYQFYYQYLLKLDSYQVKWRQLVQSVINQVIRHFHQLPPTEQHKVSILKLVDSYWKNVSPQVFESRQHYYMVLAQTTDHLLQLLTKRKKQNPPLFLYRKINTYVEELETNLSLTYDLAKWRSQSFSVTKYLVEADEEMIELYQHLMVVFSYKAFNKLPEEIEVITLLEGKSYLCSPTEENYTQGIMYLQYMKNMLLNPGEYVKTDSQAECSSCPFIHRCNGNNSNFSKKSKSEENFLH